MYLLGDLIHGFRHTITIYNLSVKGILSSINNIKPLTDISFVDAVIKVTVDETFSITIYKELSTHVKDLNEKDSEVLAEFEKYLFRKHSMDYSDVLSKGSKVINWEKT